MFFHSAVRLAPLLMALTLGAACSSKNRADPPPGPATQVADQDPPPPPPPPPPPLPAAPTEVACASTAECGAGRHCTVDDGVCNRPPGCGPEDMCIQVCYGVCVSAPSGSDVKGGAPGACRADSDCRTFSDYCTGCDCRALGKDEPAPKCAGPGVRCIRDPCSDRKATCVKGRCALNEVQ